MTKAQESQKKLAGHSRERQEKLKAPEISASDFSNNTKDAGFQCTLRGSVQGAKGNELVSVKGKNKKWLMTARELNFKSTNLKAYVLN